MSNNANIVIHPSHPPNINFNNTMGGHYINGESPRYSTIDYCLGGDLRGKRIIPILPPN